MIPTLLSAAPHKILIKSIIGFLSALELLTLCSLIYFCLAAIFLIFTRSATHFAILTILLSMIVGIFALYLSFRLRFDKHLFLALNSGDDNELMALDQSLLILGLRAETTHTRPLVERIKGTRRIAIHLILCVTIQSIALLLGIVEKF